MKQIRPTTNDSEPAAEGSEPLAWESSQPSVNGSGAEETLSLEPADEFLGHLGISADPNALAGRYTLEGPLGHGLLSTTYRAFDQDSGRAVAIKLFTEQAGDHREFRERLLRLASTLAALDHPNIASVLDAGMEGGQPFLVTELVEGQTLRALLVDQGRLSVERAATIGAQVAEGLAYAHQRGIVHGDLRPENVLVGEHGQVRIIDFGLRSLAVSSGLLPLEALTERAAYLSPEQVMGAAPNARSDVYSLAITLYEALAGAPPFAGENLLAVASQRLVREPPSLRRFRSDVPIELDNVLLRALAPNQAERYGSALELRAALLERELAVQASVMREISVTRDERVPLRPRRTSLEQVALLAPALATVAVGIVAFLFYTLLLPNLLSILQFGEVPELSGRSLSEAAQLARAAGLDVQVESIQPSQDKPKDTVITQLQAAGSRAPRASAVKLVISAGVQTPDLRNLPLSDARALVVRAGWRPGPIESQLAKDTAPGIVIGQRPAPGELVSDKGEVTFIVSGGNYAEGAQVKGSAGKTPELAVDGNVQTFWNAGGPAPNEIEIDLRNPITMTTLELVTAQTQSGPTIHEIWVTNQAGDFFAVHTFRGTTKDGDTLQVRFDQPVPQVVRVKIHTAVSAGNVSWREIRIL